MVDRDLIKELQINQPLLGRQGYRLGPIGSAQLTHNGTDMEFDRPLTDDQVSGNLFVGEALGQEGQTSRSRGVRASVPASTWFWWLTWRRSFEATTG